MKLSQKAIEELKMIYREEFGEALPDEQALEMGQRLLRLFRILARPLPSDLHGPDGDRPPPLDGSPPPDRMESM